MYKRFRSPDLSKALGVGTQLSSKRCLQLHLIILSAFSAGRCVSLDCEMVGTGSSGDFNMLARCSIVNHHGNVLYDSYVTPMDKITDYRTKFSGIMPKHLRGGTSHEDVFTVPEFHLGGGKPWDIPPTP